MGTRRLITATMKPARAAILVPSPSGAVWPAPPEDEVTDLHPQATVVLQAVVGVVEPLVVGEELFLVTATAESTNPVGHIELVVSATCKPSTPAARVDQGRLQ